MSLEFESRVLSFFKHGSQTQTLQGLTIRWNSCLGFII